MRRTQELETAITKAKECDCIICAMSVINLNSAERLWKRATKGKQGEWHRGLWRCNWKAAAQQLLILSKTPEKHLKGAPYVAYKTVRP